jgi:hypothetical protein
MMTKAPAISELIHHIKLCPLEFLNTPQKNGKNGVNTEALVNDIIRLIAHEPTAARQIEIQSQKLSREELSLLQICCWTLTHPFFAEIDHRWVFDFFKEKLTDIASIVKTADWVADEERAEELARLIMQCCRYVPDGETREQALDRFDSVNTIKRLKVLEESKAAIERAREIRRQMEEKRAREAANVYGRE